ncbi:hypothetical protein PV325_003901 [Microctonus aethiopoides]|uniref:rRNA adenine N(6)-methyltransferase n=1 Tax=Microctonus aethiopoides TaxID=144406 RepID=A0AA39C6F5_9HYME|nr:hypothetical protein PV325_003901 [Microctonus aethiopoides]KAK0158345.1 hypothetical protein PV328_009359 [Microctonus aethiopoides]
MASTLRLPPLPSVADILKLYRLRARQQLAQNFLLDERLTNKIVKQIGRLKDSCVVEVGPGPGCLTRSIMKKFPQKLIVVEKDKRFKSTLEMLAENFATINGKMDIIYDDIMRVNLSEIFSDEYKTEWDERCPNIYIVGNLPFNVSTPLIIQWLRAISEHSGLWSMGRVRMCLTFQKEVAERLAAAPSTSQRCRLSIMAQAFTKPQLRFIIPGKVFIPKPDVDVGVVTFEPLRQFKTAHEFRLFEKITRHMFSSRQKYSITCAKTLFPVDYKEELSMMMFKLADLDPKMRPMQFEVEDIDRLCTAYKYLVDKHPGIEEYDYRGSRKVMAKRHTKHIRISEVEDSENELIHNSALDTEIHQQIS